MAGEDTLEPATGPRGSDAGRFPVVGVGASAGGVEALEGFFRGVPERPGMAFVVVTHLSRDRHSILHEIIGRYTSMPVQAVEDGVDVRLDNVYVLPSNAVISIERGRLRLSQPPSGGVERKPVDIFFGTLAIEMRERAVGVVLSGGDGDGSLGVKAIRAYGGLTLAQVADGYGPQQPSMPDTAIATGMVDFAVPADEMGRHIVDYARSLSEPAPLEVEAAGEVQVDPAFEAARPAIYDMLRGQTGHDFSGYKLKTFLRRVQRRMQIVQIDGIERYLARLRQDPQEVTALFRDLLINVTNFFRDPDAFAALETEVVPKLFEGRGADSFVRVWIAGCATGEEVFSIAILLREHMDRLTAAPRVQIFATDIDEVALAVARAARYPAVLLDNVSDERRARFFTIDGGGCTVAKEVRDLCVFSPHSLIRDPPFSRIDLLSCRNLLIYFGSDVQSNVLPTFHYALQPSGYLFLGSAENVGQFGDLFEPIDKKHRIFRSRAGGGLARMPPRAKIPRGVGPLEVQAGRDGGRRGTSLRQAAEAQVLDRYGPAHVVVNRSGDVVHYSGRTGKYLEAASGMPTRQMLTMARKGLRLDLHALFKAAIESNGAVQREHLAVEGDNGSVQLVTLTIEPLRERPDPGADESAMLFLVLFEDEGPSLARDEAAEHAAQAADDVVVRLEQELRDSRERLQSMIEEYETAIEELKSSNEELVSVNEEVQSSNEELEASKEELQSLNEELHTVNGELAIKIDALDLANSDLQNLFESIELATVFLDTKLVIRSFTPAVGRIFNLLPGDRGRPITDITTRLALPGLARTLQSVLDSGEQVEQRIGQPFPDASYLMRLSLHQGDGNQVRGVVVTFVDITTLAQAEGRQTVLIAELQHRTRNLLAMVQAIAMQTLGKGGSMDSYMQRLSALGRVQSLISRASGDAIDLGEIVRLELQAHAPGDGRVSVAGPPVALRLEQVQTFALSLHELATNAVKYGALHVPDGRLDVSWRIEPGEGDDPSGARLLLDWVESGVVIKPGQEARRGYGRQLIERALVYSLQAETRLEFRAGGVACRIAMPLRGVAQQEHAA